MWRKMATLGTLAGLVVGGSAAGRIHTVRRGDTLEAIGRRYGVDVPTLVAANGLRNPDLVAEGAALKIPAPAPAPAPAVRRPPVVASPPPAAVPPKAGAVRGTAVPLPPA